MTKRYSLLIEGDDSGYSAFVPELPTILVTGKSVGELTVRVTDAIRLYWERVPEGGLPTTFQKEIEVDRPVG